LSSETTASPAPQPRAVGLVTKAVRGAFWTILSGTGARVLGILGTLAITHYLSPDEYGQASLAALLMLTAGMFANCGLSQYIASKPDAGRKAVFHATFYFTILGVVAIGLALLLGAPFGELVSAPGIVPFLPGFALAAVIDRVVQIQDRIQVRDMRFRLVGVQRSLGELVYAGLSVALAALAPHTMFGGGYALVWASIARAVVRLVFLSVTTPWREWAEPHRIDAATTRELFRFGLPMWIASIAAFGSQKFDNLVFSHHFGQAGVARYNLAYNFADMPTALIAEQVGDVLVPSFARMEGDKRKESLLLSLRMLVFLVTPFAVGLALIAPTLVSLAFTAEYADIATVLAILAMIAVPRTIIWTHSSYMQVRNTPRLIMALDVVRMFAIVIFMHGFVLFGRGILGGKYAVWFGCGAVVAVFAASAFSYIVAIRKLEGASILSQCAALAPPVLACLPMVAAVYGVGHLLRAHDVFGVGHPITSQLDRLRVFTPRLILEVVVGAIVFVPSAFLLAPRTTRELIGLVRDAVRRRRGGGGDDAPESAAAA
jgi:PST family polysaccharide transporter